MTERESLIRRAIEHRSRAQGLFDAEEIIRNMAGEAFAREHDQAARELRHGAGVLKGNAEEYVDKADKLREEYLKLPDAQSARHGFLIELAEQAGVDGIAELSPEDLEQELVHMLTVNKGQA